MATSALAAPARRPRARTAPAPAFAVTPPTCTRGVVGATSGVGRLILRRLAADGAPARAIVRDAARARAVLPASVAVREAGSIASDDTRRLRAALAGVSVLFVCTGTTAFPTRAWRGGNTPRAVEVAGMRNLMASLDRRALRQVVLLSSIGTTRRDAFPFAVVNAFGVLDAKAEGERILEEAAASAGFRYAIVRPGRLVGAPHTNVGMHRADPTEGRQDVEILPGDSGTGNCSRQAAADAMLMASRGDADLDFSVLDKLGDPPSRFEWLERLRAVQVRRGRDGAEGTLAV